jgi:anti-anti-sigma factor
MLFDNARFEVSSSDGGLLLRAIGELDMESSPVFAGALEALVPTVDEVVVDLSQVTFMDSTGLKVLCVAAEQAPVRLVGVPERLRRIISMASLEDVFDIEPDTTG